MGFWWVIKIGWQRIFLTDLTDGFLVGDKDLLATDFLTDLTDGFLVGDKDLLATDFLTDLTDGFLVGDKDLVLVGNGFF